MISDKYQHVINSKEIPENYKYYWNYQYRLGKEHLVPYIKKLELFREGDKVVEIGSAEGGVLAAFVENGAKEALATDIARDRLDYGEKIAAILDDPIKYEYHNIMSEPPKEEWKNAFDLVLLRDVIEHLDDTVEALSNIKELLKPGGYLFVTFPPYYSAYGGHQHTIMNLWGKLPFIHVLPDYIFHTLLKGGRENDIGEVKRLQKIKLTPKKFVRAAQKSGYEIFQKDFYLLRPVFKMKFGLPTLKSTPISFLPIIKNISLEACYILKKI